MVYSHSEFLSHHSLLGKDRFSGTVRPVLSDRAWAKKKWSLNRVASYPDSLKLKAGAERRAWYTLSAHAPDFPRNLGK